jgi:anti-sigma-K factor RskA
MTCAELKEQVGALAAGALEPAERQACEQHLASNIPHDGCAEALRLANEAAALIGAALPPIEPGPQLWRAIEAQLAPRRVVEPSAPNWSERIRWLVVGFAVASLAGLVFSLSAHDPRIALMAQIAQLQRQVLSLQGTTASCQHDLESARADLGAQHDALAMLQLTATAVIALAPQAGAEKMRASAIYNPQQGHAMVVASGLMPHDGKDYELWVIRGKDKLRAGVFHGDASGALIARVDPKLLAKGAPDAFAFTLEPAGGGDSPRGPIMLVGALSKG